jgi:hypothetical protein
MSHHVPNQDKIPKEPLIKTKDIQTFDESNAHVLALADSIGIANPDFDMKPYTDELWDNM